MQLAKILLWWLQLIQSSFLSCLPQHKCIYCALRILSIEEPSEWSSAPKIDLTPFAIIQIKGEKQVPDFFWQAEAGSFGLLTQVGVHNGKCLHAGVCQAAQWESSRALQHPSLFRAGIMALQLKWKDQLALASCLSVLLKWQAIFHWWFERLFILLILLSSNKTRVFSSVKHCWKIP